MPIPKTLALGDDGAPLVPFRFLEGLDALAQRLRLRALNHRGTWFLNTDVGIPYEQHTDDQTLTLAQLSDEISRELAACPGVARLTNIRTTFDATTGEATYAATAIPEATLLGVNPDAELLVGVGIGPAGGVLRAYVTLGGIA